MKNYAVWIDHQQAFLYAYTAEGVQESKLHAKGHAKEVAPFYHQVAAALTDAHELFIMGPGTAKDEFKHHLEEHHHAKLARALVGVEAMVSHPTEAQMRAKANKFFKDLHIWTVKY